MERFTFANKPGVMPGKPLTIGAVADLKHIAVIESRQRGVRLNCKKLTLTGARVAIGFLEHGDIRHARISQDGLVVSVRMGGAF